MCIPAVGYGIRSEYGIFRQTFVDGNQVEQPGLLAGNGSPWESRIPRCGSRSRSPLFACSTKEYEDGTLGLIATLPVPRRRIVLEKTATMSLQAVPVCLVTMRCVLLGRGFDLTVP